MDLDAPPPKRHRRPMKFAIGTQKRAWCVYFDFQGNDSN
jgi:hypothetical protein